MTVCLVFLVLSHDLVLFFDTFIQSILFNRLCLSGHSTFICNNLVCFDEESICWYFHSATDLNNVADKYEILMYFDDLSVSSDTDDFFLLLLFVQFHKLPLFFVVIDGSDKGGDENSYQDSKALDPGSASVLWIGGSDFDSDGDNGSYDQNPEGEVLESFPEELEEPGGLLRWLLVGAVK